MQQYESSSANTTKMVKNSAGQMVVATDWHKVLAWGGSAVAFMVLYQYKPLQTPLMWIGFILILGLLLSHWDTIHSQFTNLGK